MPDGAEVATQSAVPYFIISAKDEKSGRERRDYICKRDRVVMRCLGGSSYRDGLTPMYSSTHLCDLCGLSLSHDLNLSTDDITIDIKNEGELRTHHMRAHSNEYLACTCGGYLYEALMKNGKKGMRCPRCNKFRNTSDEQIWRKSPHIPTEEELSRA
jgi:hypothetical protein